MFEYRNSDLYCEDVMIKKLAKKFLTPLFIYSKYRIIENFREFDSAFGGIEHIICYAVKANSNLTICKLVFDLGSGADITTSGELKRVLLAGVNPKKVVFAGVGKKPDEIELAILKNILMLNVESLQELKLINSIANRLKRKVDIAIRINPNIDPHTHRFITTAKFENKFGVYLNQIHEAVRLLKKLKKLNLIGLHCHIGSQIVHLSPFAKAAKIMSEIYRNLKEKGFPLKYINLGGGLGIRYKNENPPKPKDLANAVIPFIKNLGAILILEPGRYIVGNAGIIVTEVLYIKESPHKKFIVVDASMNDIIRPALYGAYHEIYPAKLNAGKKEKFDVVGPICETSDFIGKDRYFSNIKVGDYLAIMCAGAYCFSMSSQYNTRPRPAEILVDGKRYFVIREREEVDELIRLEKMPLSVTKQKIWGIHTRK